MNRRSTKFYRKNEAEVMESLGMRPTKNSGAGWIEKEDGQNEYLLCQLKSTDAQSIRIHQSDIRILEKNAMVAHKIPVFAIQFLNTGEVWLMAKPEDFTSAAEYINTGKTVVDNFGIELGEENEPPAMQAIKSARGCGRQAFYEEQRKKYEKVRSAT